MTERDHAAWFVASSCTLSCSGRAARKQRWRVARCGCARSDQFAERANRNGGTLLAATRGMRNHPSLLIGCLIAFAFGGCKDRQDREATRRTGEPVKRV